MVRLVPAAAALLFSIPAATARELWVLTDLSRQIVRVDAQSEQVLGSIALGSTPTPVPFDVACARLGDPNVGRFAFVTQGRFLRVVDAQNPGSVATIGVGLLLPPGLTLQTMRGESAAAARDYVDGGGTATLRTHLFVAADVLEGADLRPYFLIFDQAALAGVAPPNTPKLVAYGPLLSFPAKGMQVEALGMPEGDGFERAWFTAQEDSIPPRLYAVLIGTPRTLPADDWTVRRTHTTEVPQGTAIPFLLNVANPYGTPLPILYDPTTPADALVGHLIDLDRFTSCPSTTYGAVIAVTGLAPQNVTVASIGSPVEGSPGELRLTKWKDCSTTTWPVGLDPTDVVFLDEIGRDKVFVANHGGNSLTIVRADGSRADLIVAGGPSRLSLQSVTFSTCSPRANITEEIVDADGDGPDDVKISWPTLGCAPLTVFKVSCFCFPPNCPDDCNGLPPSPLNGHEQLAGGDWEDLGTTTGGTFTHKDGAKAGTGSLSYNVEPH
jgi:hypothetical protein